MLDYEIKEDGISFNDVSNLDGKKIDKAVKQAEKMLKCIGKSYKDFGGSKRNLTLTVYCELTEEEAAEIEKCWQEKMKNKEK